MLNIKKILLPVDFPNVSLRVIHQAATMAHHLHSEIVMLHVVTQYGSERTGWDMRAEIIREAQKNLDQSLSLELDGLVIQLVVAKGDPAQTIVRTAHEQRADLIMMPSHGHTFNQFLLGSATSKALHRIECPVWTGAHVEESPVQTFAIRSVLCVVDFKPQDRKTVSWAAYVAAEFGARLTLAHITAEVKFWGPGGTYLDPGWKEALVGNASQRITDLQRDMGLKADVFIGNGDVCKALSQAAKHTKADLLVTGCHPYSGRLRTHGYAAICAVPIPVLNV